jgi:hypothetical protein
MEKTQDQKEIAEIKAQKAALEAEQARMLREDAQLKLAAENTSDKTPGSIAEAEKKLGKLDTPEGKVAEARKIYFDEFKKYKKINWKFRGADKSTAGEKINQIRLKLGLAIEKTTGYENVGVGKFKFDFGYKDLKEKMEKDLAEFKEPYDEARVVWGNSLYQERKTLLENTEIDGNKLTPEEIETQLAQYKATEVLQKVVIDERQLRINTENALSGRPEIFNKMWEFYRSIEPRVLKVALGVCLVLFATGGLATGATIVSALTGAGFSQLVAAGLVAPVKIALSMLTGTLSIAAGKGIDLKNRKEDATFQQIQEQTLADLKSRFASGQITLDQYEIELAVIENRSKQKNTRRMGAKIGASILTGAATGALFMGSLKVASAYEHSGIRPVIKPGAEPQHTGNKTPSSQGIKPLNHQENPPSAQPKAPTTPEQPAPVTKPVHESTGGQQQSPDVALRDPSPIKIIRTHPAINETSTVDHSAHQQTPPEEITENVTDAPESQSQPQEVLAGVTSEQISIGQNQELVEATKQLHEMEAAGSIYTDPIGYQELQQKIEELSRTHGVYELGTPPGIQAGPIATVNVVPEATPGFPIIIQTDSGDFRIENTDQLKYTIDHPIIHGQQFPDRELAELKQFYNKQLQVKPEVPPTPAAAAVPEAVVPRPTVGPETPPTTSTMDPIFKSPEHQLRTMHDVESQYRSHDFITEKPSGHIHGGTYETWHQANDQMFALPDNNFKFNSYEEYAQTKTLQDIFGGSRSIDGTHQPLYYANQNFRPHWREVLHMPAKDLMHFKTSDLADMAKHRDPTLQRLLETGLVKNVNIGVGKPLYEFAFEVKELERLQHMMVKILGPTHGGPYTTPPENIEQYIERATKLGIRETEDGHLYWEIKIAYTQGQVPHRGHGQPFNIYPSEQGKVGQGNWNNGGIRNMAPLDGFWRDGFKPDDQNGFSTPVPMTNRWW